jgi:hypothetical protein
VMNNNCRLGYATTEKNDIITLVSPYTLFFHDNSLRLNGEISYFVSYNLKGGRPTYKITFKARENKPQDTEYRDPSQKIIDECTNQISKIVKQIDQ